MTKIVDIRTKTADELGGLLGDEATRGRCCNPAEREYIPLSDFVASL